jgi:hypothetical protein
MQILGGTPGFNGPVNFPALQNTSSPAVVDAAYGLNSGNNTIQAPTGTEWIVVYSANTGVTFTVKGVNGDTGYPTLGCLYVTQASATASSFVVDVSSNTTAFVAFL